MQIKVDKDMLQTVVGAIKQLPVKCDFDAADSWVGIVMVLEQMLQQSEVEEEIKSEE